jgi:hemerythrin-like domain-containing protein
LPRPTFGFAMHPLIAELHQDHINLSRLLSLLERESMLFQQGYDPDYLLMLDMLDYVENYPDLIHHPREDVIFRVYLERHRGAEDVIRQLMDEHKALAALSHQLWDMIEQILQGSVFSRELIEDQLFTYIEMQERHFDAEEAHIFGLIEQTLEPEDWARIQEMMPAVSDPLFGGEVEKQYEAIYARIMAMS